LPAEADGEEPAVASAVRVESASSEPPRVPSGDELDAFGWRDACADLPLSHMGRGADDDPAFFAAAFAAGRLARGLVA